ncbi:MAG: ABC transporter ATP-binding protein [Desulfocapsaceae bacterium]|jgi:ATP-binding cassette subfamily B protein|nr:ABC transporter ATP-binding protein [Desulfocapsaceae bacterium]
MRNFGYTEKDSNSLGDIHLWHRIIKKSSRYIHAISAAVILSLIVTGATLAIPYLMKNAIDLFITADQLSSGLRLDGLSRTALQFLALILLIFAVTFVQVVLLEWVGQSVMHRIRQELFSHLLDLDLAFLDTQPTGRLVTRLTNDVQNMHEMFTSVMVTLFNDVLRLAGILVVLFFINVRLALLMMIFVPLSLGITVVFAGLAREKFRAIRSQLSRLNSYIQESVSGITIIQLFGRQEAVKTHFSTLSHEYLQRTLRQIRLFAAFMPLTELLSSLAIGLILWYGGTQIIGRNLTIGELVAFLAYMRLFFQPLRELSQKYSIVQSALASAERIFNMLDKERLITETSAPVSLGRPEGRLVFDHLTFGYEENKPVLHDLSMTIEPGQTVAVVGTTGSGKTTLISLLMRFYNPQQGTISIDGVNINKMKLKELRTTIGVILQDVFILQDTLLANIVMDSGCSREYVLEVLEQTGMTRFLDLLPDGLNTIIGEGGHELSTGEKQLLSFARVLCRNPAILILDEATAFIDSVTEDILEQAIEDSFSGRTSIIIAHRLSTIRRADHIIVMDRGKIIERGTHAELIARSGRYAEMIRLDLQD